MYKFNPYSKNIFQVIQYMETMEYTQDNSSIANEYECKVAMHLILRGFPTECINFKVKNKSIFGKGKYVYAAIKSLTDFKSSNYFDFESKSLSYSETETSIHTSILFHKLMMYKWIKNNNPSTEHRETIENISDILHDYKITVNEIYKK